MLTFPKVVTLQEGEKPEITGLRARQPQEPGLLQPERLRQVPQEQPERLLQGLCYSWSDQS